MFLEKPSREESIQDERSRAEDSRATLNVDAYEALILCPIEFHGHWELIGSEERTPKRDNAHPRKKVSCENATLVYPRSRLLYGIREVRVFLSCLKSCHFGFFRDSCVVVEEVSARMRKRGRTGKQSRSSCIKALLV